MKRVFLSILLCALTLPALQSAPTAEELRAQAERCRRILQESLIDFYLPRCLDRANGGYYEVLRDDKFAGSGEKFLTLQARHLWFFSTLAVEGFQREESLAAARHGYEFIQNKMRDRVHGGYYSKVTDAGEPKDARKHAYLNAFTLYGLVVYHRASKDPQALEAAKQLFRTLEEKSCDREFGGYIEFFERDWQPVTSGSGYVGAIGHKTYNTHLHLLEAFAELYRAWPDPLVARRLRELITINTSTVQHPEVRANVDAFTREWRMVMEPRNLRASYGHDVECAWLVLDAARTLDLPANVLLSWAKSLADTSLQYGYDPKHGGFYAGGPLGQPADDLKKTWWVQTEALLGMLELYRLTRDQKYYDAFAKTLDFCEQHHVAKQGGWWATRAADGSPTADRTRTGPWQGAYHAARALILSANWLDELSRTPHP